MVNYCCGQLYQTDCRIRLVRVGTCCLLSSKQTGDVIFYRAMISSVVEHTVGRGARLDIHPSLRKPQHRFIKSLEDGFGRRACPHVPAHHALLTLSICWIPKPQKGHHTARYKALISACLNLGNGCCHQQQKCFSLAAEMQPVNSMAALWPPTGPSHWQCH